MYSCVIDGMDQGHSCLPQQNFEEQFKMLITEVLEHGYGKSFIDDVLYNLLYVLFLNSNLLSGMCIRMTVFLP